MTMYQYVAVQWRVQGGDVYEVEADSVSLKVERRWPSGLGVVIAEDHTDRPSQLFKFGQDARVAHVTQVPDFVGWREMVEQFFWIAVVRIGDDRDAQRHERKEADFCA